MEYGRSGVAMDVLRANTATSLDEGTAKLAYNQGVRDIKARDAANAEHNAAYDSTRKRGQGTVQTRGVNVKALDKARRNQVKVIEKLAQVTGVNFELFESKAVGGVYQGEENPGTYRLTHDGAVDEVVADACEMMLKDTQAVERLAATDKGLVGKVKQFVMEFTEHIREAFEGVGAVHAEAKAMMQEAEELQRIWDVGLEEAAKRARQTEDIHEDISPLTSDELYSLRSNVGTPYDTQIKQYFDGKMQRDRTLAMENKLKWAGVRGTNIFMPQSVITKGMRTKNSTSRSSHNLARSVFLTLESDMNSAEVAVYNKKTDAFLVLKARKNANPMAYAIHFDHDNNGEFARLVSVHERENATEYVQRALTDKDYIVNFANKKTANEVVKPDIEVSGVLALIDRTLMVSDHKKSVNPSAEKNQFSIAGERAATAVREQLDKAKEMNSQGKSAKEIWEKTFWYRGTDGQWRFEIDDSGAKVIPLDIGDKPVRLEEVLDHPALYKAYPFLRDMPFRLDDDMVVANANGTYDGVSISLRKKKYTRPSDQNLREIESIKETEEYKTYIKALTDLLLNPPDSDAEWKNGMRALDEKWLSSAYGKRYTELVAEQHKNQNVLNESDDTKSVLLHEIQHVIQREENFVRGANPEVWRSILKNGIVLMPNSKKIDLLRSQESTLWDAIPDKLRTLENRRFRLRDEIDSLDQRREVGRMLEMMAELDKLNDEISNLDKDGVVEAYDDVLKQQDELRKNNAKLDAMGAYLQTGGEIEARDVQERMNMAEDERHAKMPKVDPDALDLRDFRVQFSLRDSEGRELSKEQQEFFKDSKVRDDDGNLLVVYHGSDQDFNVWDMSKGRANMDIQGAFFSPWEIDAGGYGDNVRAFYLNIKNPAPEAVGYRALNRFQGQNEAGVKARKLLEAQGYDGVNNGGEEYIAFKPEQIKRVDNTKPTENPDIRFSTRYSSAYEKPAYNEDDVNVALYDALDHKDSGDDNLIKVGRLPSYVKNLLDIGGDFYIYRDHAYENMVSKEQAIAEGRYKNDKQHFHNLGVEKMNNAMMGLEHPIMTISTKSKDGNPTVIMLLDEKGSNGAPLYAVLSFYTNKRINGERRDKPHVVLTVSEREWHEDGARQGIAELIQSAVTSNRVIDFDASKREVLSEVAKQARLGEITHTSLAGSVAQFKKEIKEFKEKNKISYSLRDAAEITDRDLLYGMDVTGSMNEGQRDVLARYQAAVKSLKGLDGQYIIIPFLIFTGWPLGRMMGVSVI